MSLDKRKLSIITFSHIVTDSYAAFIPLAVPVLIEKYNFSVALAGSLGVILSLSTNFPQIFFGYIYDRTGKYLIFLAPLLSALFVGTAVLMPTYSLMVLFLIIGGIGIAMFHPEATHIAKRSQKEKGSLAMSIFLAGGTGGYAVGGFLAAILIKLFGLPGLGLSVILGFVSSYVLWTNKNILAEQKKKVVHFATAGDIKEVNNFRQFLLLFSIVTIIVSLSSAVGMYLPAYLKQRGMDITVAGLSFMCYILPGSLGGIVVGRYFVKYNAKLIIILTQLFSVLFLYLMLFFPAPYFLLFIPFAGACQLSSFPMLVSQSYVFLPKNKGVAAASIIGLTWGLASVLIFITGLLSDYGGSISYAFKIISILPVFAVILLVKLKI